MNKKGESIKLSFLLPASRTYVSADGLVRRVGDSKPKKHLIDKEIKVLEKRVSKLQSIHNRLDSIIAELEDYFKSK